MSLPPSNLPHLSGVPPELLVQVYEKLINHLAIGIILWRLVDPADEGSLQMLAINEAIHGITGQDFRSSIGQSIREIIPEALTNGMAKIYAEVARTGVEHYMDDVSYQDSRISQSIFAVRTIQLAPLYVCTIVENVSEQKRAEETIRQTVLQDETIRMQSLMLDELSVPFIPLSDQIVIMPLIGALDSNRAQKMTDALLSGIAERHMDTAILDITGVPVVDTQVANAIVQAAQAVQLLGSKVILTGIRPEVAQTLVGMGVDLRGMVTHSTLQSGIAYALRST